MRTVCYTIIFSIILLQQSYAQGSKADSMKIALQGMPADTNRVNLLNALSYELLYSDLDATLRYATEARNLAEQLAYPKGSASAYLRLGQAYNNLGNYAQSQAFLAKGLALSPDKLTTAKIYVNMGINHYEMSDYPKALQHYLVGLKAFEDAGDVKAAGSVYNNIALVYTDLGKYDEALNNHLAARKIREAHGDRRGIAGSYLNIGIIHFEKGAYSDALRNYKAASEIYASLGDRSELALTYSHRGLVYKRQGAYDTALRYYLDALKIQEEIGDMEGIAVTCLNIGAAHLVAGRAVAAGPWLQRSLQAAKEIGIKTTIQEAYLNLSRRDSTVGDFRQAYEHYKRYILYRDSISNKEIAEQIVRQRMQYDFDRRESLTRAEQALTRKELQRQKLLRNGLLGGIAIVLLFALMFLAQRNRIGKEKKRSDELLLNILPQEIADEIKSSGHSKPRTFKEVTVMFTDFKDFTRLGQSITGEQLVAELDECFSAFDRLLQKYRIEKIKTVGDAYLCASGLPAPSNRHAGDMVMAALELRDYMIARKREKESRSEPAFEMRIGINTGPVVAGIVGVKKYAYDIWGNTVNVAARLEQCSEVGKINISGSTYELVRDDFRCVHRGKIAAKNTGEIDMYFVERM